MPMLLLLSLLQFSPKILELLALWPRPRGLERQTWSVGHPPCSLCPRLLTAELVPSSSQRRAGL